MAKVVTDNQNYIDIANAIREKTQDDISYTPAEMPSGIAEVYEAGKRAIVDSIDGLYRFFTNGQNMELLPYVLERDWQGANINMQYTFQENKIITQFVFPETIRVSLPHGMFLGCKNLKNVSGLDRVYTGKILTQLFNECSSLENCGTLNFEGVTYASNTFSGCTALIEIRISGTIGLSVDFSSCGNLSRASVESIITHLSKTKTGLTLKINNNAVTSNFTEDEWDALIAPYTNWTISRI